MSQRYIYLLCSDHRHLSNSLDIYGSDLASAEKSVKSGHNFFPIVKRARVLVNLFSMGKEAKHGPTEISKFYK